MFSQGAIQPVPETMQSTVLIYLDLSLKNSTRQPVSEETTVADMLKALK
jgi:hypothetical protein